MRRRWCWVVLVVALWCASSLAAPRKNSSRPSKTHTPQSVPSSIAAPPSTTHETESSKPIPRPTKVLLLSPEDLTHTNVAAKNIDADQSPDYPSSLLMLEQDVLGGVQSFLDSFVPGLDVQNGMQAFTDSVAQNYIPVPGGELVNPFHDAPLTIWDHLLSTLLKETRVKHVDDPIDPADDNSIQTTYTSVDFDPLGNMFSWFLDRIRTWVDLDNPAAWWHQLVQDSKDFSIFRVENKGEEYEGPELEPGVRFGLAPHLVALAKYDPLTLAINTGLWILWNTMVWSSYIPYETDDGEGGNDYGDYDNGGGGDFDYGDGGGSRRVIEGIQTPPSHPRPSHPHPSHPHALPPFPNSNHYQQPIAPRPFNPDIQQPNSQPNYNQYNHIFVNYDRPPQNYNSHSSVQHFSSSYQQYDGEKVAFIPPRSSTAHLQH